MRAVQLDREYAQGSWSCWIWVFQLSFQPIWVLRLSLCVLSCGVYRCWLGIWCRMHLVWLGYPDLVFTQVSLVWFGLKLFSSKCLSEKALVFMRFPVWTEYTAFLQGLWVSFEHFSRNRLKIWSHFSLIAKITQGHPSVAKLLNQYFQVSLDLSFHVRLSQKEALRISLAKMRLLLSMLFGLCSCSFRFDRWVVCGVLSFHYLDFRFGLLNS